MKNTFLSFFLLFLFSPYAHFAQTGIHLDKIKAFQIDHTSFSQDFKPQIFSDWFFQALSNEKSTLQGNSNAPYLSSLPRAYDYDKLAMFCKLEVQIERITKVPFRIRLGNLEYVDQLEYRLENHSNYIPDIEVSDHYRINTNISNKNK